MTGLLVSVRHMRQWRQTIERVLMAGAVLCALKAVTRAGGDDDQAAADHDRSPDSAPVAQADAEFFERKVRPLLHDHCYECHSRDSGEENGDLLLDSRAGLFKGGSRGAALVPGAPDESLLIRAVRYADEDLQMPPGGKLPDAAIDVLGEWVRRGARTPEYGAPVAAPQRAIDWDEARQFWSFRRLERTRPPRGVKDERREREDQLRNWIDTFVLQRLESSSLTPNGPADRRTLIRRVTFDLIGLPPAPEEVAEFVADDRPDAYERLVDRLLASPHYGERWARTWLDLARYTDVVADWLKSTGNAWLYRDWVVGAFNADRPYDDFVRRQLAADFFEEGPPEDLAALGYLGLSPTYWKELRLAPNLIKNVVAEEWDERVDAIGRTFLGLTVACARCHDHKFDPITVRDYYALAGVVASTQLADSPLRPRAEAHAARKVRAEVVRLEEDLKKQKDKDSEEARALQARIDELRRSNPHLDEPWAHVVEEARIDVLADGPDKTRIDVHPGEWCDLPVFRRGNPANPGELVPRRFLTVLSAGEPTPFRNGSGRRELANAILGDAQPLAARVIVNRIWAQLFGQGLVRTVSDFGHQGESPTHPELLDVLAAQFVERGWSFKSLQREIVLSAAYRRSSGFQREADGVDPENRLLWQMNRRRLDVEAWRDAMLRAAGTLDDRIGGAPQPLEAASNVRRTLYSVIGRDSQSALLRLYDFPEPTAHSPSRVHTTTPLQQLFVLNGPLLEEQAAELAGRVMEGGAAVDGERVARCYVLLFAREPNQREAAAGEAFVRGIRGSAGSDADAWRLYVQSLLGLNEFLFVD